MFNYIKRKTSTNENMYIIWVLTAMVSVLLLLLLFIKKQYDTHNFGKHDLTEDTILSHGHHTPNMFITHSVIMNQYFIKLNH